jgi:hypothetical protein
MTFVRFRYAFEMGTPIAIRDAAPDTYSLSTCHRHSHVSGRERGRVGGIAAGGRGASNGVNLI